MSKAYDGGPAFPGKHLEVDTRIPAGDQMKSVDHMGMSLRDWFAGQALAGILANSHVPSRINAAVNAYIVADAMLAQREKPSEWVRAGNDDG